MLKLIKYDFVRKYRMISMILITVLALNALAMTRGPGGSTTFLVLAPIVLYILYLVDVIKMYSDDLNKKTGYMLFMTPNSGYKIIVSKLLAAVLEGFGLLFIYFVIFIVNGVYILISLGEVVDSENITRAINNMFSGSLGGNGNLVSLFLLLFTILVIIIAFITTIYTSITIRKSLFSEIKFGGLLSFIIFLLINWFLLFIAGMVYGLYYQSLDGIANSGSLTSGHWLMLFLPMIIFSIIQAIALTGVSGYLLEKEINL